MKRKKTRFESFAQKFFIVSLIVFVFGIITIKSIESSYNRDYQKIANEIEVIKSEVEGLKMQKQQLVAYPRLYTITTEKGYIYKSDATAASSKSDQPVVND